MEVFEELDVGLRESFRGAKEGLHLIARESGNRTMMSREGRPTSVSTVPGRSAMVVTPFSSVASVLKMHMSVEIL
jgi:hypothetical protein